MWAARLVLRIGDDRATLVAVQTDTLESLALLRRVFDAWLDDDIADELASRSPAFSVHLTPPSGGRGVTTIPHLRHGSVVLARSRTPEQVMHALASVLGGIHCGPPSAGAARVWLRPFAHERRVVLVEASRPHLTDDRVLVQAGGAESVAWHVDVTRDGQVTIPPSLPALRWDDIGLQPPADLEPLSLAGVVCQTDEPSDASLLTALAAHSLQRTWFEVLSGLIEAGQVRAATDRAGLRRSVISLLAT